MVRDSRGKISSSLVQLFIYLYFWNDKLPRKYVKMRSSSQWEITQVEDIYFIHKLQLHLKIILTLGMLVVLFIDTIIPSYLIGLFRIGNELQCICQTFIFQRLSMLFYCPRMNAFSCLQTIFQCSFQSGGTRNISPVMKAGMHIASILLHGC